MRDPMDLRIVIAAGGTGGHLFPGLAVAREFQARHGATVTFITSPRPWPPEFWRRRLPLGDGGQPGLEGPGTFLPAPHLVAAAAEHPGGPGAPPGPAAPSGAGHGRLHRRPGGPGGLVPEAAPGPARTKRPARLHQPLAGSPGRPGLRLLSGLPGQFRRDLAVWTGNPIREEFFRESPPRPERRSPC